MENDKTTEETEGTKAPHKRKIHRILAHSYTVYFVFFLIGVCLDFIFSTRDGFTSKDILPNSLTVPLGFGVLIFATFLIFWAQKTSRDLNTQNLTKETFSKGPYRYARHPTHWGLFFLTLGFGIIANSLFAILSPIISLFITQFTFIRRQEQTLAEKYGAPYIEYRNSLKF